MLLKILLLSFYVFATIFLYKMLFTKLEKFDLYKKVHRYYIEGQRLLNPRFYIECFNNKYNNRKKNDPINK
jgi:ribosomal protein L31